MIFLLILFQLYLLSDERSFTILTAFVVQEQCLVSKNYFSNYPLHVCYNVIAIDEVWIVMNQLDEKCRCLILFDCCHSGTLADLPYIYRSNQEQIAGGDNVNLGENPITADVMMISGSRDEQTAADAFINNQWAGAMTHYFLKVLKDSDYSLTFRSLLTQMRQQLKDSGYEQYPVLSSAHSVNLNRHFSLRQDGEPLIK